jgi:hypothetical protein
MFHVCTYFCFRECDLYFGLLGEFISCSYSALVSHVQGAVRLTERHSSRQEKRVDDLSDALDNLKREVKG